ERDALTGVAVGERLAEHLPHAELALIDGAGHFPWIDEPKSFAATVAHFLNAR
ncbi:MAG: TAP-like protein, partial [Frankiaceae bacterium]|nr:TAP-like protein [Frankiaceae bacterium]